MVIVCPAFLRVTLLNSASCDTVNMDFKGAGSCEGTSSSGYSLVGTDQMAGSLIPEWKQEPDYSRMVVLPPRQQKRRSYLELLIPDQNRLKVVNHRPGG